jgi:hypothetical protein
MIKKDGNVNGSRNVEILWGKKKKKGTTLLDSK